MPKETARKFLKIMKNNGGGLKAEFTRKNGEAFPIQASIKSIELDEEKIILVVVHDLTTQEKIENELLKGQKLESLGILAGGIAHDFNNIMTTVIGNLSLLKMYPNLSQELLVILEEMENACFGAKDLTQQLLTFAKGGMPVKKTVPLAGLIQDSAQFALRGSNVSCEFDLPEDICPVEVDEGQINQVINNLIINAGQAMPEGGTVFIKADNIKINKRQALPLTPGKYMKLTIKDQGVGIRKGHLGKIFDPYFTTKQKGSGLGLSTAYSIIKKHDGHIEVDSEMGVGTSFQIYLPASGKKPGKIDKRQQTPLKGQGKILLMDDQESIRAVMDKMLRQLGYDVTLSRDGAEAIEIYQKALTHGEPFDVVIMDLTIPGGMGGKEAIGRFKQIDPEVKALAFSGYSNDPLIAKYAKFGFVGVITKPFRVTQLSKTLYEVITQRKLPQSK
jgi:signal transduction histidine kinase/ActR/RegA family two-component response regulator